MNVVDPLVISGWVDGVVLVVRGGHTPYPLVQGACRRIQEVKGKLLGIALNDVAADSRYYYSKGAKASGPVAPSRTRKAARAGAIESTE